MCSLLGGCLLWLRCQGFVLDFFFAREGGGGGMLENGMED